MAGKPVEYRENPPDRITICCFTYMARTMELRDFLRFFFGIVNCSDTLSRGLTEESKKEFETEADKYRLGERKFSPNRQFVNEILVSRAVESFELYLLHMLRLIFGEHPEIVLDDEKAGAKKADFANADDFFLYVAERKLQQLSYKPLTALREYIMQKTAIDLFDNNSTFETALLAIQARNLIAHNDCRVNELFLKRISVLSKPPAGELGNRYVFSEEWVKEVSYVFDHVVFQFDEFAAKKMLLPTMNRFTSFLFRG